MIPYIVLFLFTILLSFPLASRDIKNYDKFFCLICVVVLSLFSGLASSRGDYPSYKTIFNSPFENSAIEIGHHMINYFIKGLGGGYHLSLFIITLAATALKIFSFRHLTKYVGLAVISYVGVFFVPADMGSIRFGLAMGFFMVSIRYIQSRDFIKFSLIIIFGCLFHFSLIVSFLLYIFCAYSFKKKHYILILCLSLISYLFIDIGGIVNMTRGIIPDKYNLFLKALAYLSMKASINFALVKRIVILIIVTIFYKKLVVKSPYFRVVYNSYFLSIVTFLAFSLSFYMANRTSWLFASIEPILLSNLIYISKSKNVKLLVIVGIVIYSIVNMCHIVITQTEPPVNLYYPYKIFFL